MKNKNRYLKKIKIRASLENSRITKPVQLYKFQAQIFSKAEPNGKIFEKKIEYLNFSRYKFYV